MGAARVFRWALWGLASLGALWAAHRHDGDLWVGDEGLRWALGLGLAHLLGLFLVERLGALGPLLWPAGWPLPRWVQGGWRAAPPLLALGIWIGAGMEATPPPAPPARPAASGPSILLLTLDTTRADHVLGGVVPTPALDALAAQGRRFTEAVTTAPLTAPAHASLLTGVDVEAHGLRANGRRVGLPTVTERLQAAGYRTGAFLSARVLQRATGLDAGFDHYDDRWGEGARLGWLPGYAAAPRQAVERPGAETVDRALRWFAEDDRPTFLWVHLYDPHAPYLPDEAPLAEALALARAEDAAAPVGQGSLGAVLRGLSSRRPAERRLLYEAEVAGLDGVVGRLLDALPPAVVVVAVADHGESLGDNDYWFNHGARLWEATVRVPMVVRWPGRVAAGEVDPRLVSVEDVAAVIAAAGVGGEAGPLVAPLDAPGRAAPVFLYTTGQEAQATVGHRRPEEAWHRGPSAAARLPGGKVMAFSGGPAVWFDLTVDGAEANPLPVPAELAGLAAEVVARANRPVEALTGEERELLEALGYVE